MRLLKILSTSGLMLLGLSMTSIGQSLEIDLVAFTSTKVIVKYRLLDAKQRFYSVALYSSKDGYANPLKYVSGDVGRGVLAGKNKEITWEIDKELGDFSGAITFKISCSVEESSQVTKMFKKGKTYKIEWNPVANLGENIKIELIDNEQQKVWEVKDIPNVGNFNLKIPPRIKAKHGYRLKFTNMKNAAESNWSNSFGIRSKIPFLTKAVGVALIGGAAIFVISSQSSNSDNALPEFSTIGFPDK
jgi:hypothetical protein